MGSSERAGFFSSLRDRVWFVSALESMWASGPSSGAPDFFSS